MLPQNHLVIAIIVIIPAALILFPGLSLFQLLLWVVLGGAVAALIDMDIIIIVFQRAKKDERLRPYTNIRSVSKDFKGFVDTITETGVLRIGLMTHVLVSVTVIVLFHLFLSDLLFPVVIGVVTHLVTDVPYIGKLRKRD